MRAALHPSERVAMREVRRRASRRAWRRAAVIATPIVAGIALTSYAALSLLPMPASANQAMSADKASAGATPNVASSIFSAISSPGEGATGTADLPPEPLAASVRADATDGISPAAPFLLVGASALDRARALECLTAAIYYEAASEPDDGQRAVAQVVLNRVRHPAFPATVCGVVYQGSERKTGCQFSYACDGAMARIPSRNHWARAARNAAAALRGHVFEPVGLATHYHTYAVTPSWNRTLVMTDAIGAHFFHRWKGYWGTAAAFRQRYAGNEPVPGPVARASSADSVIALAGGAPIAGAVALPAPPTVAALTQGETPTPAGGLPQATTVGSDDSQILDRWKDSGKPLR